MTEETPAYETTPEPPATFERLFELDRLMVAHLAAEQHWVQEYQLHSQLAGEAEASQTAARAATAQCHEEIVRVREALAKQPARANGAAGAEDGGAS